MHWEPQVLVSAPACMQLALVFLSLSPRSLHLYMRLACHPVLVKGRSEALEQEMCASPRQVVVANLIPSEARPRPLVGGKPGRSRGDGQRSHLGALSVASPDPGGCRPMSAIVLVTDPCQPVRSERLLCIERPAEGFQGSARWFISAATSVFCSCPLPELALFRVAACSRHIELDPLRCHEHGGRISLGAPCRSDQTSSISMVLGNLQRYVAPRVSVWMWQWCPIRGFG